MSGCSAVGARPSGVCRNPTRTAPLFGQEGGVHRPVAWSEVRGPRAEAGVRAGLSQGAPARPPAEPRRGGKSQGRGGRPGPPRVRPATGRPGAAGRATCGRLTCDNPAQSGHGRGGRSGRWPMAVRECTFTSQRRSRRDGHHSLPGQVAAPCGGVWRNRRARRGSSVRSDRHA